MLAPILCWFVLSATVLQAGELLLIHAAIRISLTATFTGLAAYEFWRSGEQEDLPSRRILFWVFAAFSALNLVRIPIMHIAPMPIGMAPTTIWAIIVYNLATVALVLDVSIFMIALSRERQAARHYSLALRDAITGVHNRRAYYEYIETLPATGSDCWRRGELSCGSASHGRCADHVAVGSRRVMLAQPNHCQDESIGPDRFIKVVGRCFRRT